MGKTSIEWATDVWNPVTGCTKVSQGCKNCYAKTLHDMRHKAYQEGKHVPLQYAKPFETVQLHPDRLELPLHWKKPRRIFVNSMSDLFHPDVPDDFISDVFRYMAAAEQHAFMVLTKRPERMAQYLNAWKESEGIVWDPDKDSGIVSEHWPLPNVWLGVSVENQDAADERIHYLLQTPARTRFVSAEPLLGPIELGTWALDQIVGIDWLIVGGESGPNARPMHPQWARRLRDQCQAAGVPFFFKQWGEWITEIYTDGDLPSSVPDDMDWDDFVKLKNYHVWKTTYDTIYHAWIAERVGKKSAGRLLDGREWNEYPEGLNDER